MSKEIEVKLQISSDQLNFFSVWLTQNADFIKEIDSSDYYLDNPASSFFFTNKEGYLDAMTFFRVRMTGDEHVLCVKKRILDETGRTLYCDESEVLVADGNIVLSILEKTGYITKVIINKQRKVYVYKYFEIVIDNVENLGIFVEVELKTDAEDPKEGKFLIYNFLKSIGIAKFKNYKLGYASIMLNPTHDFSEIISM